MYTKLGSAAAVATGGVGAFAGTDPASSALGVNGGVATLAFTGFTVLHYLIAAIVLILAGTAMLKLVPRRR